MSKRRADVQLTRDYLDKEDSPERDDTSEPAAGTGVFAVADKDVIAKRIIRKAKRSIGSPFGTEVKPSPFATASLLQPSYTGSLTSSPSAFAFSSSNSASNPPPAIDFCPISQPPMSKSEVTSSLSVNGAANGSKSEEEDDVMEHEPAYYQKLKNLNRTFKKTVDEYMGKGINYDFTPVCKDYIKFISTLNEQYPPNVAVSTVRMKTVDVPSQPQISTPKPEARVEAKAAIVVDNANPPFSFVGGGTFSNTSTTSSFQMQSLTSSKLSFGASSGPSTFGAGSGFSAFGSLTPKPSNPVPLTAPTTQAAGEEEDENYEPPVAESAAEEDGAVYSKPDCKFFFKEKGLAKFEAKGKGTLHVKKTSSGKHQLIFRAANALGTIWMNIILATGIPITVRTKHVILVSVPNPPLSTSANCKEAVNYMIKCASEDEAQELATTLNNFKS